MLLVHPTYLGRRWQMPGGYVEPGELATDAVAREVEEETGVRARAEGLVAVRHRLSESEDSVYLVFLMTPEDKHEPTPDGREVDAAAFMTLAEIEALEGTSEINRWVARRVLGSTASLLKD